MKNKTGPLLNKPRKDFQVSGVHGGVKPAGVNLGFGVSKVFVCLCLNVIYYIILYYIILYYI